VEVEVEKPVIEYKDRWHTRRMDKRERDSLKHVERMLDKQLKHTRRMGKQTDKHIEQANQQAIRLAQETTKQIRLEQRNPWVWVLLAAIALAALILIKFK
jgi:t-SNARE complex subunit (syntaxin)